MPNFFKAIQDSILDGFTIKPITNVSTMNSLISGQIQGCDEHFIYIRISEGFEDLLLLINNESQLFDVNFFTNRTTYQLQHNSLNWLEKHGLFKNLIDNPQYAHNENRTPDPIEYKFR